MPRRPPNPAISSDAPPLLVSRCFAIASLALLVGAGLVHGQRRGGGGYGGYGGRFRGEAHVGPDIRTPRQLDSHSTGTPDWTNPAGFEADTFRFARLRYTHNYRGGRGGWSTDTPDSDLDLSYRLQQMTSMRVDPDGIFLQITPDDLAAFPFTYIVEPGALSLGPDEVAALRSHLLNGGFLMLDDFWGDNEWENVEAHFRLVFPDRAFVELPLDHDLYKRPFTITSKGQVPNVGRGLMSQIDAITYEREDAQEVHHRAILDDTGRIMVLATHNTDNGDGWEREGEDTYYFRHFSEKISYPLGINIIFYIMTH